MDIFFAYRKTIALFVVTLVLPPRFFDKDFNSVLILSSINICHKQDITWVFGDKHFE